MKVDGPRGPSKTAAPRKAARSGSAGSAGFANALKGPEGSAAGDGEDSVEAAHGAAPATSLDALLAIQGVDSVPDATEEKRSGNKAARQWGEEMLDGLEEIRRDLLHGAVPPDRLATLAQVIGERKAQADDPGLKDILGEIELRARVELAKLRRSG